MPEQMMCPMRSDAKMERHCEPLKCMWARRYEIDGERVYVCSAVSTDKYLEDKPISFPSM